METQVERRRSPRFKVGIPVRYRRINEEEASFGVGALTHDLSTRGLRFETKETFSPAEQLVLELDLPGQPVKAVAQVAWSESADGDGYHVGGQFMEITRKDEELIAAYLKER